MEEIVRNYESECESDLEKDDSEVLRKRYDSFVKDMFYKKEKAIGKKPVVKLKKSHWTRIYDSVQEHYSSHVLINQSNYLLPSNICALKQAAKASWMLYKKRECERRKRLRLKIEKEKELEEKGCPSNLLLSMVDACEVCKKLYITVNLFWGITLCDICYFNEEVISDIMKDKVKEMKKVSKMNTRKILIEAQKSSNITEDIRKKYFTAGGSDEEEKSSKRTTYIPKSRIQKIVKSEEEEEEEEQIYEETSNSPFDTNIHNSFEDLRVISNYTYNPISSPKEEEKEVNEGMSPNEKVELNLLMETIDEISSPFMYFEE